MKIFIMKRLVFILIFFSFLTACGQTKNSDYWSNLPQPIGWVNDFDHLYTEAQKKTLDSLIADYEQKTSVEISLVTIPATATDKEHFEDLTLHMAQTWGVGKKDKNNGILIGISKEYRVIRIQNGLGIEKLISDNQTKQIIDSYFIPNFKKGDFFKGSYDGIIAITKMLDKAK